MYKATAFIRKGEGRALKAGGLWIFDNEIEKVEGEYENGDLIDVRDFDGYYMGVGFINTCSRITIRMMSRKEVKIDKAFIDMRVKKAYEYRKAVMKDDMNSCRLVFGEADFLPGIVIDKFADTLVVQSLALGIDKLKSTIVESLKTVLREDGINIRGVYERSDAKVRNNEGMELFKGFLSEKFDTNVVICENDVKYYVDICDGQKTGFFLDQKFNRRAVGELCKGKTVLDCFTHTGSFALNAAKCGAEHVTAVDISELGIETAKKNAELNGLMDNMSFVCEDVFELLPRLVSEGTSYDVLILDPPAFSKSRASVKNAMKGYREINMKGMKLVKDGGFLVTCSCSHFMPEDLFKTVISQAAAAVHKRVRQVEFRTQSPDHPILWNADESSYLKLFILQLCDE